MGMQDRDWYREELKRKARDEREQEMLKRMASTPHRQAEKLQTDLVVGVMIGIAICAAGLLILQMVR